ncbi:MAG: hypothetical protein KBT27_14660 [Prevotellaceae bacterium]|nr:hypothetical protein [Candidatus Faecinaster equi]
MKKLMTILLCLAMALCVVGCSKKNDSEPTNPVNGQVTQVGSILDFEKIGVFGMHVPSAQATDVKFYTINNQVAQMTFNYSGINYVFRGSKILGVGSILGIDSAPKMQTSDVYEGINYQAIEYPEGLAVVWVKDMTTYSIFAEGATVDDSYAIAHVAQLCAGLSVEEEEKDNLVELPEITKDTTKDEMMKFFDDNGFKSVNYKYQNSDSVKLNHIIGLSKAGKVNPIDPIECVVSAGPDEPAKPQIVNVPGNMLNYSETKFIEACKALGMGTSKNSTTYYSTTIMRGNIFCYPDGDFPVGTVIKYNLSRGPYTFDPDKYNGLTKAQAKDYVNELNNLNAHVELVLNDHETDNHPAGTIYKCNSEKNGIKTIVTCRLAKKPSAEYVDLPNYVGSYSNPCGGGNSCSLNQINYKIEYQETENPKGLVISQSVPAGKVLAGTGVTLVISKGEPYLYRVESGYYDGFRGNSFDQTVALLQEPKAFGGFSDVQYQTISDGDYPGCAVVKVEMYIRSVHGWTENYNEGYYPSDTPLIVTINIPLLGPGALPPESDGSSAE